MRNQEIVAERVFSKRIENLIFLRGIAKETQESEVE